jgi:hypothetical protein
VTTSTVPIFEVSGQWLGWSLPKFASESAHESVGGVGVDREPDRQRGGRRAQLGRGVGKAEDLLRDQL